MFPGGRSGIALLVLRATLGVALFIRGAFALGEQGAMTIAWCSFPALAGGALLTIGLLTPFVAILVALGAAGSALSLLPYCAADPFNVTSQVVFATAILVAVLLLGPGAFSVDARVFGRREIIIPPASGRR